MEETIDDLGIAIIGMAGRFPGASNINQFWENLRDGVESIRQLSDEELRNMGATNLDDPRLVKVAAIMDDIEMFDAAFFGYTPTEATIMDPQQRVFLEAAWQALEHAGYEAETYPGSIGVYGGSTISTYLLLNLLDNPEFSSRLDPVQIHLGNAGDFLTTRVSYKLNLKGPSHLVGSACSTSLVAVHQACQSLLNEECDMALAGGVSINIRQRTGYRYIDGAMESPDGQCRAFDAQARGTLFGCGAGIVVLKRLQDALNDGDTIHAVIKGSAINNDGSLKVGFTAPGVEGQAQVITEALSAAGVEPDTISYIEAHGTGTALGDPIEIQALTKAFRASTQRRNFCGIGSVKTNVGHLEAAAGVTSLIKTILALKHRQLPPSLHFEKPNPAIDFAGSPFYVVNRLADWPQTGVTPRRAGVSSFGFGGTNVHLIVEEAPVISTSSGDAGETGHTLLVSARSDAALETATANLLEHLTRHPEQSLADVAYTLQVGRKHFNRRRALVCRNREEAIAVLQKADPTSLITATLETTERPVVFMFTGQGAQHPGMARFLYEQVPYFQEQLDRCARLLWPHLGFDLTSLLYPLSAGLENSRQRLNQTALAQPALFVVEYALAKLWQKWGLQPQALIGHSIGEYVAACLAGVFSLEDALALVVKRGKLMQEMPLGAMLAVGLSEAELDPFLYNQLSLAAVNSPQQCVVAGPLDAIAQLEKRLTETGIAASRLYTSHAFHSAMMEPVVNRFAAEVAGVRLQPPQLPVVSNLTGDWLTAQQATDPHYWASHLRQTVRFSEGLALLARQPEPALLEVGPGQNLAKLARRHPSRQPKQPVLATLPSPQEEIDAHTFLWSTLSLAWLNGLPVNWEAVHAGHNHHRVPLPTYPFERQRYWVNPLAISESKTGGVQRPAETGEAGHTKNPNLADWFYLPIWERTALPPQPPALKNDRPESWLILGDDSALETALSYQLTEAGQPVTRVHAGASFANTGPESYTFDPAQAEDYDRVLANLAQPPSHIVHLWSRTETDCETAEAGFITGQAKGFSSLIYLAQALERHWPGQAVRVTIVSQQLVDVSGNELIEPARATLLGAAKVLPQEYSAIRCRVIDLARSNLESDPVRREGLARQLRAELMAPTGEDETLVAYRNRQRWVQKFEPVQLGEASLPWRPQGVYLIVNGLESTALALAHHLAQSGVRLRLILTTATEPADRVHTIQKLEALGAEVSIMEVNQDNPEALRTAVEEAFQRYGALHGVIYCADEAADQRLITPLTTTDPGQAQAIFENRWRKLLALEKALSNLPELDFCLVNSSLATVLGGSGYASYAAANSLIDAFVQAHNQNHAPWLSVNWDAWRFEENQPQLSALSARLNKLALTPPEGAEAFKRIISHNPGATVVISTADLPARLAEAFATPVPLTPDDSSLSTFQPRPALATLYVAPETELENKVAAIWQSALGFERVGLYDNFFDLGGESLAALQVIARLKKELSLDLPVASLYERLTVKALVELIEAEENREKDLAGLVVQREAKINRRKQFQENQRTRKKERVQ